ncbi:DNA (cytosine-5-)-methyltransferase [Heyndrickxia sporothermodurans]|uniref:DNA cytosine methyltransferase n=1 Tax=Heyndrickxia sporothermodurans TaxID=46224 RepID=UPI002E1BB25D|nr:DNA (cytosine-5-)-methyltransferase [Heyndrickxia sporothermodurans]
MIKLATVFSGIGAIEHALKRMGLPHEIVFACDNGDIDVLSEKILPEIDEIEVEINVLKKMIDKISTNLESNQDEYTIELANNFLNINKKYKDFINEIDYQEDLIDLSRELLSNFIEDDYFNENVHKAYAKWIKVYESDNYSPLHKYIEAKKSFIKIEADYKRIYGGDFVASEYFKSMAQSNEYTDLVDITEFKQVVKVLREVSDALSMLHEKINTSAVLEDLKNIESFEEKNAYVNRLYKGQESRNRVRQSYMANYDVDPKHFHWNASFLDGSQYHNQVDLFVGGSPCQSFSLVGKQRGLEDTRGTLFYEFARLVKEIQPKVFIYENVKAVLSNDDGNTWRTMKDVFDELNYDWHDAILNAKDYGVPQNRERLFVVGFRKDLKVKGFKFPEPIKLDKTMQDYLIDNVSGKYFLPQKGVNFVTNKKNLDKRYTQIDGDIQLCQKKNQQFNWHGDFVFVEENKNKEKTIQDLEKYFLSEKVKRYVLSSGTKGFYSRPETDLDVARPLLTSMHKMHRAGVDNYVTTEGRLRKLTPRECLRLMGFCDSFKIVVADTPAYQQAGNSIVVDVLIAIVDKILEYYPNLKKGE